MRELENIARLRRIRDALRDGVTVDADDALYLADALTRYFAHARTMSIALALGIGGVCGHARWWEQERQIARDNAIAEACRLHFAGDVQELHVALGRYAATAWRADSARREPRPTDLGRLAGALWSICRLSLTPRGALRIPGRRQLVNIVANAK